MSLEEMSRSHGEEARVRGGWCAILRRELNYLMEHERRAIGDSGIDAFDDAIAAAGCVGWVPAASFSDFIERVVAATGEERFGDYYQHVTLQGMGSPLLRASTSAMVRLLGRKAMVRSFAPAWELVARGCARIQIAQSESMVETTVAFSDLPPSLQGSRAWTCVCLASLRASIDFGGFHGRVTEIDSGDPTALRFQMTMHAKADDSSELT